MMLNQAAMSEVSNRAAWRVSQVAPNELVGRLCWHRTKPIIISSSITIPVNQKPWNLLITVMPFVHSQQKSVQGDLEDFETLPIDLAHNQQFWSIDCLVHNTSRFYPTPFGQISQQDWQNLFLTNANPVIYQPIFIPLSKRIARLHYQHFGHSRQWQAVWGLYGL